MYIFHLLSTRILPALALSALLFLTACSDNPAGGDDEHADPEGLELVHDGEVIYEYFGGELTEHSHRHFLVGEEYLFEVRFLNENGEAIDSEYFDESYSLRWDIGNENVLQIHQQEGDSPWSFLLGGVAEGESKVQFQLMHGAGENAHPHLETASADAEAAIEFHIDAEDEGEHNH